MKLLRFLVIALAIGTLAVSCGKYDDGPKLSLMTKKARLAGDWIKKEYIDPNGNSTSVSNDEVFTFKKNGDFSYVSGSVSMNGAWKFTYSKERLKIKSASVSGNASIDQELTILRLTNKELWIKDSDGNESKMEAK